MNKEKFKALKKRNYETIFIFKMDIGEDSRSKLLEKCTSIIKEFGDGTVSSTDDWGRQKIAYPIEKNPRGHWTILKYNCKPEGTTELHRQLKINEDVLRFNTYRDSEDKSNYPKLKEEMVKNLTELGQDRIKFMEGLNRKSKPGFSKKPFTPYKERKNATSNSADNKPS